RVPIGNRAALSAAERVSAAWAALDCIDELLASLRPRGAVSSGKVSTEHERYFALKELADAISDTLNAYENRLDEAKRSRLEGRQPDAIGRKARYRAIKVKALGWDHWDSQPLGSMLSATSMEEALRELFDAAEPLPGDADLFDMENQLALLHLMAT